MNDLEWQLMELQTYAESLSGLMSGARDSMPDRAEGRDRSGSVWVEIGPDGIPLRFHVAPDWPRRLAPDAFGAAAAEACQVAVGARLASWTAGLHQPRLGQAVSTPAAWRARYVESRSLGEITEDLIQAFDDLERAERRPSDPSPRFRGRGGGGRLTLKLSDNGLTSCTAEARWTANQTGARLTMALSEALDDAKAQCAAAPETPKTLGGLDMLFAEAMALLGDSRRLAG